MSKLLGLNILIVDDEPDMREILIDLLAPLVSVIYAANNGQEALKYLESHKVDIMLSDVQMPFMSGLDLVQQIRDRQIQVPAIIMLSGQLDVTESIAINLGASGLIHKPYSFKVLIGKIESLF